MAKKVPKQKIVTRLKECADVITAVGIIGAALVGVGTWCTANITAATNNKIDDLSSQMKDLKLDTTRNQLLTMMSNYPDNEEEILKVAKYYFRELDGDWYITSLFTRWASARNIDITDIVKIKGD